MKILVTGGSGFIGSNFIHYMMNKYDYEIVNMDLMTYAANSTNLADVENENRYEFIHSDINLIRKDIGRIMPDVIINFAAESHVDNSIENNFQFVRTNIEGVYRLLSVVKEFNIKFIQVSTDEIMGHLGKDDPPFTEESPLSPRNPYSATKAAAEHLCMAYFHTHKVPVMCVRPSNNYGPYQFTEKLLPLAITNILNGKPIPVYGAGENVRDWLYVEDNCRAIDMILHNGTVGELYNIGGNCERKNIDIAKLICKLMGVSEDKFIKFVEDRKGHDFRYSVSYKKINKKLGWTPGPSIEERLPSVIDWYKNNQKWWSE